MSYMNVNVSSSDIASKMISDSDFAYDVLSELSYFLSDTKYQKYINSIFKNIFEEENTELLNFLSEIVNQFEHLKEENEISNSNPST